MQFEVSVGDWSDDGHGKERVYVCETDVNDILIVREAFFELNKLLGFKFEDICGDYEENKVAPEYNERLLELGLIDDELFDYFDGDNGPEWEQMVEILMNGLNLVNPNLNVRLSSGRRLETLHFYGYDEKNRHIGYIGYGLFY